jgi:hypothetical protein
MKTTEIALLLLVALLLVCLPPFRDSLGAYIERSAKRLLAEGACTSGLTLIVQGGVWRGCTKPNMQISRLGDYTLEDNFMGVMFPYLTSHFERVHMADVNRYEEWFEPEPAVKKPEKEVFGEAFVVAIQ